ncbi:hypothetical protein PMIN01_04064 [Paraphaeosphaeria minitans]|uniref:Uncharacterized protein n=1 Tax=Paraphaeosphaeria minitans TaxID=565426 RepID=A0A9P6GP14_9PLEO|nr:hypothetical protein PMIN01_04064 [Paraphaeosphaeria minitans]
MADYNYSYSCSFDACAAYTHPQAEHGNTSPTRTQARAPASRGLPALQKVPTRGVDEADVGIGHVFWLPPQEELPPRAVRRAHGKGAVEEGIYNHPIVVVSRPAEEPQVVHFHIVTSFQGKRLHEMYPKNNEFHASRRSWYLPISPSPPHPDATSKKMQKRFPTLALQHSATLRWDSYVNIRHVYKIAWPLLKPYTNPDTPHAQAFRLDRESCDKMLSKTKLLTNYDPATQHPVQPTHHARHECPASGRPAYPSRQPGRPLTSGPPLRIPDSHVRWGNEHTASVTGPGDDSPGSPRAPSMYSPTVYSDGGSVVGSEYCGLSPTLQSDFGVLHTEFGMDVALLRKRPPDGELGRAWFGIVFFFFFWGGLGRCC